MNYTCIIQILVISQVVAANPMTDAQGQTSHFDDRKLEMIVASTEQEDCEELSDFQWGSWSNEIFSSNGKTLEQCKSMCIGWPPADCQVRADLPSCINRPPGRMSFQYYVSSRY